MRRVTKSIITIIAIFSLFTGILPMSTTYASSGDMLQVERLRAIASLVEYGLYELDEDGKVDLNSEVTIAELVRALIRLKGYPVSDVHTEYWFDSYYGSAVINGILVENEYVDYEQTVTRSEFVQLYYRTLSSLPADSPMFIDLDKKVTWGEVAEILYEELVRENQLKVADNLYIPLDYSFDYIWSVEEFNRFMSEKYVSEYTKYVKDFKIADGEWKIENQSLNTLVNKHSNVDAEFIKGKVYTIMRQLVWEVRKNDDFIDVDYNKAEGIVSIKIYADKSMVDEDNPALWVDFVPTDAGRQNAIDEPSFELYLAHMYDLHEKLDEESMSRGEFSKYIKTANYMEDDFAEYLDVIGLELFTGKDEDLISRMKESYDEIKSDPGAEVYVVSSIRGKFVAEWSMEMNGEDIYGFKARISENLK